MILEFYADGIASGDSIILITGRYLCEFNLKGSIEAQSYRMICLLNNLKNLHQVLRLDQEIESSEQTVWIQERGNNTTSTRHN